MTCKHSDDVWIRNQIYIAFSKIREKKAHVLLEMLFDSFSPSLESVDEDALR